MFQRFHLSFINSYKRAKNSHNPFLKNCRTSQQRWSFNYSQLQVFGHLRLVPPTGGWRQIFRHVEEAWLELMKNLSFPRAKCLQFSQQFPFHKSKRSRSTFLFFNPPFPVPPRNRSCWKPWNLKALIGTCGSFWFLCHLPLAARIESTWRIKKSIRSMQKFPENFKEGLHVDLGKKWNMYFNQIFSSKQNWWTSPFVLLLTLHV